MTDSRSRLGTNRVDHVGVAVRDADESAEWYVAHFGYSLVHEESLPAINVRLVYLAAPGAGPEAALIQLVQPIGPGALADYIAQNGTGLHHVCLRVADIPESLQTMTSDSYNIFLGGYERLCVFVQEGPEGALVELTEDQRRPGADRDQLIGPWPAEHKTRTETARSTRQEGRT